jgi:hypothetical protein
VTVSKLSLQQQALFLGSTTQPYLFPIVAQFPVTPPGDTWTGTISAVAQNVVTSTEISNPGGSALGLFDPGNDFLSYIVWTLYRNGQAEQTWQGSNMLCNIQSFGDSNDQLTVSGVFPTTVTGLELLAQAVNVTVNFIGYRGSAPEIPLVVPFVSQTAQNPFNGLLNPNIVPNYRILQVKGFSGLTAASGTQTFILTGPAGTGFTGNVLLLDAWISLSNLAGASATSVNATVKDGGGNIFAVASLITAANTSDATSITVPLYGQLVTNFPVTLSFTGSGSGLNFLCSAGVQWQNEFQLVPFIP